MLETSLELLNILNENGFKAYIVGGFVRDYLLGIKSVDVDICTSATPKQLLEIFPESVTTSEYGSVILTYKNIDFEITTFRKEIKYINNRKPEQIVYIDTLEEDLQRRDITINTLCMDSKGKIIDLMNASKDMKNKLIRVVGDPMIKLENDALRILRCVRFAVKLKFRIDTRTQKAIRRNAHLLLNLSYERKKEELDKIFASPNIKYGINLIKKFGLDKYLELNNLNKLRVYDDLVGIWASLDVPDKYPLTKNVYEQIEKINELKDKNLYDLYTIYQYGPYLTHLSAKMRSLNTKKILSMNDKLRIYNKKELEVSGEDIIKFIDKEPDSWVKEILKDVEKQVVYNKLENNYEAIKEYIVNKYKN